MFEIVIPGNPVAKRRAMCTTRGGHAAMHNHPKNVSDEDSIGMYYYRALGDTYLTGPIRVDVLALFKRPKALCKIYKRTGKSKYPAEPIPHDKKPDRDNVDKIFLDALRPWLRDDCIVWCGTIIKAYTGLGEIPRTIVRIREETRAPLEIWESA